LEFLIGKFLGLSLTLFVNLLLMSVLFLLAYAIFKIRREGYADAIEVIPQVHPGLWFDISNMGAALALHFGQLAIMAALALTLSMVVTNITAIIFCFWPTSRGR
jgi:hypothetical protein